MIDILNDNRLIMISSTDDFITGIFDEELPNRFMARVIIDGAKETCYVKSSSRLSNYLPMRGKKVILRKNINSKFMYYIYSVSFKNSQILLCPSYANDIVAYSLNKKVFSFVGYRKKIEKEVSIGNYKSDIFLDKEKVFIEVKSIISDSSTALFPIVYSERFDKQLELFTDLLKKYRGYLFLVCFNPYTTKIIINKNNMNYNHIVAAMNSGLIVKGFVIGYSNNIPTIKKEIPVEII